MSKYPIDYQHCFDIDWFFTDGCRCFHVASNGGAIPNFISVDKKSNIELQCKIAEMGIITTDIKILDNPNNYNYNSFIEFAKKGFVSIDKVNDGFDNQNYYVVAEPNDKQLVPAIDIDLFPKLDRVNKDKINIIGIDGETEI